MPNLSVISLLALVGALSLGAVSTAQAGAVPVTLNGFNDDIIANGNGPAQSSTTNDMDGGQGNFRYCFVAQDFVNSLGDQPQSALPTGGLINSINSNNVTFQLADYTADNTLRLTGASTGKLTFVTPQATSLVYLLVASGNGLSTFDITITFADQTTQTVSGLVADDWFGGANYAIQGISRVNYVSDAIQNSTIDPRLYEIPVGIATANLNKPIASITFDKTATGPGTLNVMAVSVTPTTTAVDAELEVSARVLGAYPNPANSSLTVEVPGTGAVSVFLTDLTGRQLLGAPVGLDGRARFSLASLAAGAYQLQAQYRDGLRSRSLRIMKEGK